MGNKQNGKIIEIIDNPTEAGSVQTLFNQFDQDKNGQLDKEEWKLFGKYLWLANVKGAKEDVKAEVRPGPPSAMTLFYFLPEILFVFFSWFGHQSTPP